MASVQCLDLHISFDLHISKSKLLKDLLLVAKVLTVRQNFHSYFYLETHRQEKAAHTNNKLKKK